MKRIKPLLLLTLFACAFLSIAAQERKITEQEMSALRNSAAEKLKGKSYRVKMTSESYRNVKDSAPYYFTTEISEHLPGNVYRIIWEQKTPDGTTRTETINIGARKYKRVDKGDWQDAASGVNGSGGGTGGGSGRVIDGEKTVEYFYRGKKSLNNQKSALYEIKTVTKYNSPDWKYTSIYIERFWLNEEGVYLKTEIESGNEKKVISRTVREYEYDPNIKIEAPVK